MKVFLAIVVIAVIALIGSRLSFNNPKLPLGFRTILLTGTEYIFLGLLLGGQGIDLLDIQTLASLEPALLFALGWIGFLIGLQFNFKEMRKLPRFYFPITVVQSLFTFAVVAGTSYLLLGHLTALDLAGRLTIAGVLGAVASHTSPSVLAIVANHYKFENVRTAGLLRYVSGVDSLVALLLFTAALSVAPLLEAPHQAIGTVLRGVTISIAMGVVPALVFIVLHRNRFRHPRLILFLIGTVTFCAGLADAVDRSPLVAGLICGVLTANYCTHRARTLVLVQHAEHAIYVIMLLLIGASWQPTVNVGLLLVLAYVAVRGIGKVAGAFVATRLFRLTFDAPPQLGLGLLPEGGLGIAMVISFGLLSRWPVGNVLTTVIVLAVLLSDLIAPRIIVALFGVQERRLAQ